MTGACCPSHCPCCHHWTPLNPVDLILRGPTLKAHDSCLHSAPSGDMSSTHCCNDTFIITQGCYITLCLAEPRIFDMESPWLNGSWTLTMWSEGEGGVYSLVSSAGAALLPLHKCATFVPQIAVLDITASLYNFDIVMTWTVWFRLEAPLDPDCWCTAAVFSVRTGWGWAWSFCVSLACAALKAQWGTLEKELTSVPPIALLPWLCHNMGTSHTDMCKGNDSTLHSYS